MKIKQMVTEVLTAADVVPQLAKYIAGQIPNISEDQILKSITDQVGKLEDYQSTGNPGGMQRAVRLASQPYGGGEMGARSQARPGRRILRH